MWRIWSAAMPERPTGTPMKLCLVCSGGGHLLQLFFLKNWWSKNERFWVSFRKEDAQSLLREEKIYWAWFPTNRNIKNLARNTILALRILLKEKPEIIISTGAGVAIPFFYLGKLLKMKLIYIEVMDRLFTPSLTGKIVYPIADAFILQAEEQKKLYPKGMLLGQIL